MSKIKIDHALVLVFAALVAIVAIYYLFLLSNGTFRLFATEMLDKVYDNMLVHLLHGRFDINPKIIDFEAFTKNGKTYTYFGMFPALLRLFAMPFANIATIDLARISCLTADVTFVALQLAMVLTVHNSLSLANRRPLFLGVMLAATALSGPQLYILGTAAIYHESILWSAAMAAAFNLLVVRAAFRQQGFSHRDLISMAILAGLAINTRPTIGVALYLGTLLLVARQAWRHAAGRRPPFFGTGGVTAIRSMVCDRSVLLPVMILGMLAAGAGIINFERWGNPFTFADFRYYGFVQNNPNFARAFDNYGEFSLARIWIGLLYYATGLPYMAKDIPRFAGFLASRVAGIEAPPFPPLLTNPLTIVLAAIGVYQIVSKPQLPPEATAILRLALLANLSAVLLVLAAMFMTMRFRFDFAPFMTLAAVIGYRSISISAMRFGEAGKRRMDIVALGLCGFGILGSHYILLVHKVWSFAVPMKVRLALFPYAPFAHAAFGR
ncbi:MAG TPA: hypothetical protein VL985_14735 [Stellaceae bacterium]|nr:hypothetical protein [Stellaceae bacterium]